MAGRHNSRDELDAVVLRAKIGGREAVDELFRRIGPMARRLVIEFIGEDDDVQDVVQDILLRTWKALPRLKSPELFPKWFGRICISQATSHLRRRLRRKRILRPEPNFPLEQVVQGGQSDVLGSVLFKEQADLVAKMIQDLPDRYREVLLLSLFEGVAPEEIAARLRKKRGTVRSLLSRGLKQIRQRLELGHDLHGLS